MRDLDKAAELARKVIKAATLGKPVYRLALDAVKLWRLSRDLETEYHDQYKETNNNE